MAAEPAGRTFDRRPGNTHHANAHADRTGPGDPLRPGQRPGRGVRAVESRPNSRAPPHLAGCRYPDVMPCDLTVLPEEARHGREVRADLALRNVPAQILDAVQPSRLVRTIEIELPAQQCLEDVGFTSAFDGVHERAPRLPGAPSNALRRRRARCNIALRLAAFSPCVAAISSCDQPCAYASHSRLRSRGLSCSIARSRSMCRATRSATLPPPAGSIASSCSPSAVVRWGARRRWSYTRFVAMRNR